MIKPYMSANVLCVGSAVLDAFLTLHDANIHCHLNDDTCELCFKYGEKIPVDQTDLLLGGNAANVAVGLSRLGIQSSIAAEIGDDEFAHKIVVGLEAEKVDTRYLVQTSGMKSSMSVIINFKGERTIFSQHVRREHNFSFEGSPEWVYLTSLGEEWKMPYTNVLGFVKQTGAKLAFNPGTLQIDAGEKVLDDVLKQTEVLFVNKEEALKISNFKFLISNKEEENTKELLQKLQGLGPKVVVVTDGKVGSYAIDDEGKMYTLGCFPGKGIEKTGAGDAYATGFLAATIDGLSVPEAMRWGSVNAASVIGKIGAQVGLLRKDQLQSLLNGEKEFLAKEMEM